MDALSCLLVISMILYSLCNTVPNCIKEGKTVIGELHNCSNGVYIDCTERHFFHVPSIYPKYVRQINLQKNLLHTIRSCDFSNLTELVQITLSENNIHYIESRSFFSLPNLKYLNLNSNKLGVNSIAHNAFVNIPLLQELNVQQNKFWASQLVFDPVTLETMTNLTTLRFDVYNNSKITILLKSTSKVDSIYMKPIGFYCLRNYTFEGVNQNVKRVGISMAELEKGSFCHFKNLDLLSITVWKFKKIIHKIFDSLECIRHQNITRLEIKGNPSDNTFSLGESHFKYIRTMCVKELDLSNNAITNINHHSFRYFALKSRCLEILDLSNNILSGKTEWLLALLDFRHLKIIKFSHFENYWGDRKKHNCNISTCIESNIWTISIPHSLEKAYAQYIYTDFVLSSVKFIGGSKLKVLDLSFFTFCVCYNSIVMGIENLEVLDTSGWDYLGKHGKSGHFLSKMPKLKTYISRNSSMGNGFLSKLLFNNTTTLQHLDLSGNDICFIPDKTFDPLQKSLIDINLSGNDLTKLPLEPENFPNLESIDLTQNKIRELNENDRSHIDKSPNIKIYLRRNPLQCICSTIPFIKWSGNSKIKDFGQLKCHTATGQTVYLSDFQTGIKQFEQHCISETWLVVVSCISVVVFITFFTLVICFKYRYWFQYWRLKWRMQWNRLREVTVDFNYEFDAFMSHSHSDSNEILPIYNALKEKGFNICLDAKDFIPGIEIAENIIGAIDNSRRIIFVVTENFLKSSWGSYEIEMTRMHAFRAGRENMVVVIIKEGIPLDRLPRALKNIWYKVTCIKWSNEPQDDDIFHEQLYLALS